MPQRKLHQTIATAVGLLNQTEAVSLLDSLRIACDYNIDLYRECVCYIASKLQLMLPEEQAPWPIYALRIAEWESSQSDETKKNFEKLIFNNQPAPIRSFNTGY